MKPHLLGLHHDHLDGSMPIARALPELYELSGVPIPFEIAINADDQDELAKLFRDVHVKLVQKFSLVTRALQTEESIRFAVREYARARRKEGHTYVETYLAPQYHTARGLTMREVARAFVDEAQSVDLGIGIRVFPHICIGREADVETGMEIARIALEFDGEAALNLVCDEAEHPPEKHLSAFRLTFGSKVKRDCHAGEWVAKEPASTYAQRLMKNVRTALFDLKCDGVGHAIPLADHPDIMKYMADHGIRVSGCPLSNLTCGAVKTLEELRIPEILHRNVRYTLNPDDDFFLPAMPEVIERCDEVFHFTETEVAQLESNVFAGAFAR